MIRSTHFPSSVECWSTRILLLHFIFLSKAHICPQIAHQSWPNLLPFLPFSFSSLPVVTPYKNLEQPISSSPPVSPLLLLLVVFLRREIYGRRRVRLKCCRRNYRSSFTSMVLASWLHVLIHCLQLKGRRDSVNRRISGVPDGPRI